MKYSATSLITIVLFFSALAQSTSHPAQSLGRRSTKRTRSSRPINLENREKARRSQTIALDTPVETPSSDTSFQTHPAVSGTRKTSTNEIWAGAVLHPPPGQSFNAVSGRFVLPTPQKPAGGWGEYGASIWIGIDGDTSGHVLQAGIDMSIDIFGSISYRIFYEWYPSGTLYTSDISASAGDTISISITSSDPSTGVITMQNLGRDQTTTLNLQSPGPKHNLIGRDAEWIVEDTTSNTLFGLIQNYIPFLNFGAVTFTDVFASSNGLDVDISQASIMNIQQKGVTLTAVTIDTDQQLTVNYL